MTWSFGLAMTTATPSRRSRIIAIDSEVIPVDKNVEPDLEVAGMCNRTLGS